MRRGLLPLLAAFSLVASGCGSGSTPSAPPRDFYGIAPNTPLGQPDFVRMGRANVGSLRFLVYWPAIQTERGGALNWTGVDPLVIGAAKQHIALLPFIQGTPAFQTPGCTSCVDRISVKTPAERADWRRFLRAAVRRYGPGGAFWKEHPGLPPDPITRWQMWNEENNPAQGNPPATYARLLGIADSAIHSADPSAEVILGGMFGTPKGGPASTAWRYLASLYAAGAGSRFDDVALHPYAPDLAGITFQLGKIRKVMQDNGDGSKPILVTEIGWGSGGKQRAPGTGARGQVLVVSPQEQARDLTRSFNLLTDQRASWRIAGVYWFSWKDPANPPPGLCAFCYSSGLYQSNGTTPKPSLAAYKRFTAAAGGSG